MKRRRSTISNYSVFFCLTLNRLDLVLNSGAETTPVIDSAHLRLIGKCHQSQSVDYTLPFIILKFHHENVFLLSELITACVVEPGPPAEQIVFSQQVDFHLPQTRGIDIIIPRFCDSCSFGGGERYPIPGELGTVSPERFLVIFL